MSELIKTLVDVKDPLTLFAFLALVALVAFRTRRVPELFFGLLKEKLTRDRFSHLAHRAMVLTFAAFALLCVVALAGQIFAVRTQAKPVDAETFQAELRRLNNSDDVKRTVLADYTQGLSSIQSGDTAAAIESLKKSVSGIPTLSAQYTLAYLYKQRKDFSSARMWAERAAQSARQQGNSFDIARADRLLADVSGSAAPPSPVGNGCDNASLVGDKLELPYGGRTFEDAVSILPGRYIYNSTFENGRDPNYFKIVLKKGETIDIRLRTPHNYGHSSVSLHNGDGGILGYRDQFNPDTEDELTWEAKDDGNCYINMTSQSPGAVYMICKSFRPQPSS